MSGVTEESNNSNPYSVDEFAAPVLAEVAAMDNESIGLEVLRMSGYSRQSVYVFQDAFERMSPERLLGLYVLVQTLNDIEPLDTDAHPSYSDGKRVEHHRHEQVKREHRIAHHQKIEQDLKLERLSILREYRAELRNNVQKLAFYREYRGSGWKQAVDGLTKGRKTMRARYERKIARFKVRCEDLDTTNAALEYVLRDRDDVRLWCDVADVNVERFYKAVERRLLLKGRCSIELHNLLEEMRQGKDLGGPRFVDKLARYEERAYSFN